MPSHLSALPVLVASLAAREELLALDWRLRNYWPHPEASEDELASWPICRAMRRALPNSAAFEEAAAASEFAAATAQRIARRHSRVTS
jgi:hypothetical protein